jgi:ribosomal protein S18 acetylase RimI-like enzyme
MENIIYEEYRPSERQRNKEQNKKIYKLAKKNKFYPKLFGTLLGVVHEFGFRGIETHQFIVAKKQTAKTSTIVGFICYETNTMMGRLGPRMLNTLRYWLVDEKYQGKGIGATLYKKMVDDAGECGVANLCVEFDATNQRLCDLYARMGYKFIPKYDGEENKGDGKHIKWYGIKYDAYKCGELFGGDFVLVEPPKPAECTLTFGAPEPKDEE